MNVKKAITSEKIKLQLVTLTELWLKSEDAKNYAARFKAKLNEFDACKNWAKRLEICCNYIETIQSEMRHELERNGGFKEIEQVGAERPRVDIKEMANSIKLMVL
jgi:hypothetical protein